MDVLVLWLVVLVLLVIVAALLLLMFIPRNPMAATPRIWKAEEAQTSA